MAIDIKNNAVLDNAVLETLRAHTEEPLSRAALMAKLELAEKRATMKPDNDRALDASLNRLRANGLVRYEISEGWLHTPPKKTEAGV